MKNILVVVILLISNIANAQSIQINELKGAVGFWKGKLTYLDYTSGKRFSIFADILIKFTNDNNGLITSYLYPQEPHANSRDTTYIVAGLFCNDRIVAFKKKCNGNFVLITEKDGEDGNNHKKTILKHTYVLKSNLYSVTKEIRFEGSDV